MISLFMRVTVNRWNSGVAVNMSPCHGEDRGFDSRLFRHRGPIAQLGEQRTENPCVDSSILSWATICKFFE